MGSNPTLSAIDDTVDTWKVHCYFCRGTITVYGIGERTGESDEGVVYPESGTWAAWICNDCVRRDQILEALAGPRKKTVFEVYVDNFDDYYRHIDR